MQTEIIKIISYLNLLELPLDRRITKEDVEKQYRILAHVYHPDVSSKHYNSGAKFIKLKEAHDFIIDNIDYINFLIENNFSTENSTEYQNRGFFNDCSSNTKPENKPQNYDINPVDKEHKNVNKKNKKVVFVSSIVAISLVLSASLVSVIVVTNRHNCSYHLVSKTEYCDKSGSALYRCDGCGESYTTTVKAKGHNYVVSSEKEAKCLTAGSKTYKCTNCQDSYTETIKALGHNYTHEKDCTRCGQKRFVCSYGQTMPYTVNLNFWTGSKMASYEITNISYYYNNGMKFTFSGKKTYQYSSSYDYVRFRWQVRDENDYVLVDGEVYKENVQKNEYFTVNGTDDFYGFSYTAEKQYYIYLLDAVKN